MKKKDKVQKIAERIVRSMAYNRETFKDKVEEHVGGAWIEFYKARLAQKNGQTEWVQHWMTEVNTLLNRNLVAVLKHSVRGFKDLRKAIDEVIAHMKSKDMGYRRSAEMIVKRDYKLTKLKQELTDQDSEDFWQLVESAVEIGLV